jgi:hypothetical protein
MDDIETLISGKYEIKIIIKYGTSNEQATCLKLNLDEKNITKLPEIVENRVILPIQMFRILWELNNKQKMSPRRLYRW